MKLVCAVSLSLTVLISSSFSASIDLIQEINFTVPMLQGEIIDFDFNDIDSDGNPEILACDTSIWVLYSIYSDSILFWESLRDSTPTYSTLFNSTNVRLLLDDVIPDTVIDIAVCTYLTGDPYGSSTTEVELKVYDGSSSYQTHTPIYFDAGDCYFMCGEREMGALTSIDVDGDETKELVVSFHALVSTPWDENTLGFAYIFDPFPDSQISRRYFIPELNNIKDFHDYPPVIEIYTYSYTRVVGENVSRIEQFGRFDSLFYFKKYQTSSMSQELTNSSAGYVGSFLLWGCSGNVDLNDSANEFVCLRTTENNFGSVSDLGLYRIVSPNSIATIWDIPNISENYNNFMYHPLFPGFFFAFVDNAFTQFEGQDGSVFQFTTNVPDGKREWDYPFNDSIPHLIVRNGTSVSIYKVDISTPMDEIQPHNLPKSFELSQPHPNPFNPEVNFTLSIPTKSPVKVEVFDVLGRQIETVYEGIVSAGELKLQWKAKNNPSGIYLFKASCGELVKSVKAVLLK